MDILKSKHNTAINLLFAIILMLGVGISSLVYWRSESIIDITLSLVDKQIPTYDSFQKFHAALTQQERYIYEYYATQEAFFYTEGYMTSDMEAEQILRELTEQFGTVKQLNEARRQLVIIQTVAEQFHENMTGGPNWDLAREYLVQISQARRDVIPQTEALKKMVEADVLVSHQLVENQSNQVRIFVIVHFIIMLVVAFVVARSVKSSLSNEAISQRLALFPKRNPNPVISIDDSFKVVFANPATETLLNKLNLQHSDNQHLVTTELKSQMQQVKRTGNASSNFELTLNNIILRTEIHWLQDIKQWDLHINDITAQKQAEDKLHYQAYHHPETGISNQYELRDDMQTRLTGEHFQRPFTLILAAVAEYNNLVSSKGTENAQLVINQVARSIKSVSNAQFNEQAKVYHISDNGFIVIIDDAPDSTHANQLVEKLELDLSCSLFHCQVQPQLHYGVVLYPKHGADTETLIRNARSAIAHIPPHSDEIAGFYCKKLGEKVAREAQMVEDIKTAIARNQFELYFQPQVEISEKQTIGAEVLIRWPRESGWISPGEFIPVAERSGLIVPLGDWILKTACEKAREIVDKGYDDMVIAVNISPKQFGRDDFVSKVANVLEATRLPAKNLELEITEGVIIYNESQTIDTLHKLKEMGIQLAIDDFGTGYSSLSYLKQFPIDKLKIDQSFVRDMHTDSADESIVRTVIDLGQNLSLKLIAEGVEEQAQWDLLQKHGCHEIQGYFYSKPLPYESFDQFLMDKFGDTQSARLT